MNIHMLGKLDNMNKKKYNLKIEKIFFVLEIVTLLLAFWVIENKIWDSIILIIAILILVIEIINYCYNKKLIFFFPRAFFRLSIYTKFIIFSIAGTIPILIHYYYGGINRPHHIIGNTAALPILVVAITEQFKRIERKYKIIDVFYNDYFDVFSKILNYTFQLCLIYVISFFNIYNHTDRGNSEFLNMLYLTVVMLTSIVLLGIIIMYLFIFKKNIKNRFTDFYPLSTLLTVGYFLLTWSYLTYYDSEHEIEITFYLSVVIYIIVCWIFYLICYIKTSHAVKETRPSLYFCVVISLLGTVYAGFVSYAQKYNKRLENATFDNLFYVLISLLVVVIICLIIVSLIISRIENNCNNELTLKSDEQDKNDKDSSNITF